MPIDVATNYYTYNPNTTNAAMVTFLDLTKKFAEATALLEKFAENKEFVCSREIELTLVRKDFLNKQNTI